jgi:hypothetical protein
MLLKVAYSPSTEGPSSPDSWNPTLRKVREGWGTPRRAWAGEINGVHLTYGAPGLWHRELIIAIKLHNCNSGKSRRLYRRHYRRLYAFEL